MTRFIVLANKLSTFYSFRLKKHKIFTHKMISEHIKTLFWINTFLKCPNFTEQCSLGRFLWSKKTHFIKTLFVRFLPSITSRLFFCCFSSFVCKPNGWGVVRFENVTFHVNIIFCSQLLEERLIISLFLSLYIHVFIHLKLKYFKTLLSQQQLYHQLCSLWFNVPLRITIKLLLAALHRTSPQRVFSSSGLVARKHRTLYNIF